MSREDDLELEVQRLRLQLKTGRAQVEGIVKALIAMAGDAKAEGCITPPVRQNDQATQAQILEAFRQGRVPNLSVPCVRLEFEHILAFWSCLNYYTQGLIPQQPFTLAPDLPGRPLLPGISFVEPEEKP